MNDNLLKTEYGIQYKSQSEMDFYLETNSVVMPEVYQEDEEESAVVYDSVLEKFYDAMKISDKNTDIEKAVDVIINYLGDTEDYAYMHFIETMRTMSKHKVKRLETIIYRLFGWTYREMAKELGINRSTQNDRWLDAMDCIKDFKQTVFAKKGFQFLR